MKPFFSMPTRKLATSSLLGLVGVLLLAAPLAIAADSVQQPVAPADAYGGTVRAYVVEPDSRWTDALGTPYSFGFLDFAIIQGITVADGSSWTHQVTWNGQPQGFGDLQPDNVVVIVAVFNDDPQVGDALPPFGFFFDAYYVDAATSAAPGELAHDDASAPNTHTVFIEEGTVTT
ncbi:hypothetical protein GF377_00495 [candidate division GN15 bacterium]|nr:hypothetical protein [candidate division GN15 bacterium]